MWLVSLRDGKFGHTAHRDEATRTRRQRRRDNVRKPRDTKMTPSAPPAIPSPTQRGPWPGSPVGQQPFTGETLALSLGAGPKAPRGNCASHRLPSRTPCVRLPLAPPSPRGLRWNLSPPRPGGVSPSPRSVLGRSHASTAATHWPTWPSRCKATGPRTLVLFQAQDSLSQEGAGAWASLLPAGAMLYHSPAVPSPRECLEGQRRPG